MRRRYREKPGLDGGRVVLGLHAFVKGWIVTFGVGALSTLLFCIASEIIGPNPGAVTVWGFTMVVSLVVALFVAAPLALVLRRSGQGIGHPQRKTLSHPGRKMGCAASAI